MPPEPRSDGFGLDQGLLRIVATVHRGRTVLSVVERSVPFVLGPPSYRAGDGAAEVILQQVGPGLFPGDDLRTEVTVEAGARLTVRAQGATRCYPCPPGERARLRTTLRVAEGGELVYLPGELIPFRDAELRQETSVQAAPGARLALAEIVAAGRVAMGERDAYRRLDLRLRVDVDGRPALIECARLDPAARPLPSPGRHGPFSVAGSLYLVGGDAVALSDLPATRGTLVGAGWSGGVGLVRVLAPTAQDAREAMAAAFRRWQGERDAEHTAPVPLGCVHDQRTHLGRATTDPAGAV